MADNLLESLVQLCLKRFEQFSDSWIRFRSLYRKQPAFDCFQFSAGEGQVEFADVLPELTGTHDRGLTDSDGKFRIFVRTNDQPNLWKCTRNTLFFGATDVGQQNDAVCPIMKARQKALKRQDGIGHIDVLHVLRMAGTRQFFGSETDDGNTYILCIEDTGYLNLVDGRGRIG